MSSSPALLALQGYTGASTDTTAVMNYLESMNTLSGHSDPADEAQASDNTNPPDFTNGTCSTAFGSAPA